MALWRLTSKPQIKGYKREELRVDEAITRGDVRGISSPRPRMYGSSQITVILAVIALGVAWLMGYLKPKPDHSLSEIMVTRSGGTYVQFNGRVHEVTNLASARLIIGKPEEAKIVTDEALRSRPFGPRMGIPDAPQSLAAHNEDVSAWAVCDWRDTAVPLSLLKSGDISTTVIAGNDLIKGGNDLGDSRAILVKSPTDQQRLWLIYRNTRAEIGRDDNAALAALGITPAKLDTAITVSQALLDTIPASPVLTAPDLPGRGQPSQKVPNAAVGDILTTSNAAGTRQFYLVGRVGIQQVPDVLAQMMINTGSNQQLIDDPSKLRDLVRLNLVDADRFPKIAPTLVSEPSMCWTWKKTRGELTAQTSIITGQGLPTTDEAREQAVKLLPARDQLDPHATDVITSPGLAWYARVTGETPESVREESLLFINPNGTRYAIDAEMKEGGDRIISYDPTVKALGLNTLAPASIPWTVARLFSQGETLSIKNARVYQGTIKPQLQVPNPENKNTPGN